MAAENGDNGNYTGLHAFVFITGVDPGRNVVDVIDDIGGPRVPCSPTGG
jgi:hypothetical protein